MKPNSKDSDHKQLNPQDPQDREALERAIRRERLIDWLVNVSIYIHQLDAAKKARKKKPDQADNTQKV
jgi:ATP-dependent helicase YprA (DUF1998 family)